MGHNMRISDSETKMANIDHILIGQSAPMREVKQLIELAAPAPTTTLIQGETGTGKELVARALHKLSGRGGKLVCVNCSAIPSELLESELFGHEKGAFTGADKGRAGKFEQADKGTLFLDEIGDMPLPLQAKLLRALENRVIQRVGSSNDIAVDFKLICATHQNIEADIEAGKFRADLFYRINVFPISLPRLADRHVDIPQLVETMIASIIKQNKAAPAAPFTPPQFTQDALEDMMRYSWPGNVRELRNLVERACLLYPGRVIEKQDIRNNLLRLKAPAPLHEQKDIWDATSQMETMGTNTNKSDMKPPLPHPSNYKEWFLYFDSIDLRRHLQEIEITLIQAALVKTEGTIASAAEVLKLRRTTLIEKMRKFTIRPQEKRDRAH